MAVAFPPHPDVEIYPRPRRGRLIRWLGAVAIIALLAYGLASTGEPGNSNPGPPLSAISRNWSGYVWSATTRISSVSATWTVPTLSCGRRRQASDSAWVGVDGAAGTASRRGLLQAGSLSLCTPGGQTVQLWWEYWPANSPQVVTYVFPGDVVHARVWRLGPRRWSWSLRDETTAKTYVAKHAVDYPGPGSSAEWIVEDPAKQNCKGSDCLLPFARFSTVRFSDPKTQPLAWGRDAAQAVDMVQNGRPVAVSTLTSSGTIVVRSQRATSGRPQHSGR